MKIVVIGGTGLIGAKAVALLREQGHSAVAAAPSTGVDTITGDGLAEALSGADALIDVANAPSFEDQAAIDFFQTSGRNVTAAALGAGLRHHVVLSIVGTDQLQNSGYFRAKRIQEELVERAPTPFTVVRATQFFEFIRTIAELSTSDDTVRLPPVAFQPIAARDVAAALVEAALAEPAGGTLETAGPERLALDGAVRTVLGRAHDRRTVVTDPGATYLGIAVSDDVLVPAASARLGETRLDQWLRETAPRG